MGLLNTKIPPVVVDQIVADAKSMPELLNKMAAKDPTLAKQITGVSLVASKTPIGIIVATGLSYVVAKYGLGWDDNMVDLVAGMVVIVVSYIARYLTAIHVSSVLPTKTTQLPKETKQ